MKSKAALENRLIQLRSARVSAVGLQKCYFLGKYVYVNSNLPVHNAHWEEQGITVVACTAHICSNLAGEKGREGGGTC